jgi:hypothetical protein
LSAPTTSATTDQRALSSDNNASLLPASPFQAGPRSDDVAPSTPRSLNEPAQSNPLSPPLGAQRGLPAAIKPATPQTGSAYLPTTRGSTSSTVLNPFAVRPSVKK